MSSFQLGSDHTARYCLSQVVS